MAMESTLAFNETAIITAVNIGPRQTIMEFDHRYLRKVDSSKHSSSQKIHFKKSASGWYKQGRRADMAGGQDQ